MVHVTTIIPAYNREAFVGRAIESVLEQTQSDFELVVVDDASTDRTVEVVEAYDDERVHCLRFETNRGANAARNAGVEYATGEYVTFLDSDDEYDPMFLETVIEYLSDAPDSVGGVYTSRRQVRDGREVDVDLANQVLTEPQSVVRDYRAYGFSNWALRADVFDSVGPFDESFSGLQDREFLIRYLDEYEFHPITQVLVTQHQHGSRMSANPTRKLKALEDLLEKHGPLFDETARAYVDYHRGWLYARNDDMGVARRYFWRALRRRPLIFKFQLQAVGSLFGQTGFEFINALKQRVKHIVWKRRLRSASSQPGT